MKLGTIKRILKETLGSDIPKAVESMLDPLNTFIEQVGQALQGRLTFEDNFLCKRVTQTFSHGVENEINPKLDLANSLRVTGVFPIGTGGNIIDKWGWRQKDNGNIGVTLYFNSAVDTSCTILILLGQ